MSAIAAIAAVYVALKSYQISKDGYVTRVHEMYLNLMLKYDYSKKDDHTYLNTFWYGRICDFFEFVSNELYMGRLRNNDMKMFKPVMQQKQHQLYAKEKNNKSSKSYEHYLRWLNEN